MVQTLKKVLYFLFFEDPKRFLWLVVAIVVMSLFDMIGVASVFPFLTVVSDPEIIQTNEKLRWVYDTMGFDSKNSFLVALGGFSFVILVISNVIRATTMMAVIRFTWMKHYNVSRQLLSQYLYEPYVFFLNRNSSELTTYLMSEVARVVSGVLIPCMQVFARILLVVFIFSLLLRVDPFVVIMVLGVIGGGYALIYLFFRKKLSTTGEDLQRYGRQMYKALNESFGGIKDIKLLGKEHVFIDQYAQPARKAVDCYCSQFLIAQLPRYAFEATAFGGILIIMMYIVIVKNDYQNIIPLVGLYALSAYRLMPALQQIFQDVALIRFNCAALNVIYEDFAACRYEKQDLDFEVPVLPFSRTIQFKNVTFRYPKSQQAVVEGFNLAINAKTTVGFVGGTGAGKTTLIDILLGLLSSQEGKMIVDDVDIDEKNVRMWQKNIGYVPQHIYLSDDTMTRNIAFGVPDEKINHPAVERAARLASIHDFIQGLPEGYKTEVGERGVRISGGQRQRIGIARALYYDPCLLVFDEATSALDGITEDIILEAIHRLTHEKTIIIIAHRLTTVKECDTIYLLEQGRIMDSGTYEELLSRNRQFQKMAKVSTITTDR